MARMADDAQPLHVRLGASIHAQEDDLSTSQDKTFKQAMASLNNPPCTLKGKLAQINDFFQDDREMIGEDETTVIKLHERFAPICCNPTARAAMAKPNDVQSTTDYSNDKSVIVMDCGASTTMTGSLLNCADIVEKITTIETAKDGEGMITTFMQENIFCEEQGWRDGFHHYTCDLRERTSTRSTQRKSSQWLKNTNRSG
jgi:hypothetical protein